jgi:hypothetical protein
MPMGGRGMPPMGGPPMGGRMPMGPPIGGPPIGPPIIGGKPLHGRARGERWCRAETLSVTTHNPEAVGSKHRPLASRAAGRLHAWSDTTEDEDMPLRPKSLRHPQLRYKPTLKSNTHGRGGPIMPIGPIPIMPGPARAPCRNAVLSAGDPWL